MTRAVEIIVFVISNHCRPFQVMLASQMVLMVYVGNEPQFECLPFQKSSRERFRNASVVCAEIQASKGQCGDLAFDSRDWVTMAEEVTCRAWQNLVQFCGNARRRRDSFS